MPKVAVKNRSHGNAFEIIFKKVLTRVS